MIFLLGESKTGKNWYFRAGRKTVSKAPEQPATYHDTPSASKHVIRRILR
jgi:hypothetical protein